MLASIRLLCSRVIKRAPFGLNFVYCSQMPFSDNIVVVFFSEIEVLGPVKRLSRINFLRSFHVLILILQDRQASPAWGIIMEAKVSIIPEEEHNSLLDR